MTRRLHPEEIDRQLTQLADWTVTTTAREAITATYELDDFAAALSFVNSVGDLAEQAQHHPDIDIRWNRVILTLSTHTEGGLTQADVELAHQISAEPR